MESEESGFEPRPKYMDDASLRFLPSSFGKKLKKKRFPRKFSKKTTLVIGLVIMVVLITLFVALLVCTFLLWTDLKVKKVFTGSMTISNKMFTNVYEDSSSTQFKQLSSLVSNQMKDIYSGVPELSKHYLRSSIQAFSESSDDSVIAYYLSEFSVPESQISAVVKAIKSTEQTGAPRLFQRQSRRNNPTDTLLISSLTSSAVDARLINSTLKNRYKESYHCREGQTGIIQSPGFPNSPYLPNTYAEWQLRADPNHRVRLELIALDLEDDCHNDFIRIYDTLVPAESQVMAEKCGSLHPNKELVFLSSGNVMLVTLVTNGENNLPGFRAKYSQVASEIPGCGGKLSGMQGSFMSPAFPACYPPQIQCVWDIEVPTGKHVMLNFSTFSMRDPGQSSKNCSKDYVEINSNRICGEDYAKEVLSFKTNKLEVKFYSDMSYVDDGFSAQFEAFDPVVLCPGSFQCDNGCIPTKLQCDGYNDCRDMSDERNCVCELSDIKCKNGFCKPKYFLCDGLNDCGDNTDEEDCGHCKPDEIVCRNGRCVSDQKKCDGQDDCEDGTDESDCEKSVIVNCTEFTFRCKNDVCISKKNPRCDGDMDCEDGSDEADCNCGTRPYKSSQIVGGVEAAEGEWPWQVSLHLQNEGHVCGASLISNLWLITAAHCIQEANRYSYPEHWQVYLGLHRQGQAGTWTVRKKLNQIICHPDYNPTTNNNDIALMELESPVTLNQYIWPICLPSATRMLPAGQSVWIAGWGKIRAQGKMSTVLQEAEVRIINSTVCAELLRDNVTPQMICAGVLSGGVDACQGDSGGQLSYLDPATGRSFLVGVVSWGRGCGLKGKPGVYTRVSKFRSWIRMETGV